MADAPAFAVTPRISSVLVNTAESSWTAPTNVGTLITGAATGTRIAEIVVKSVQTSAAAIIRMFLYDGTTYYLFDEISISAATGSNTVQQSRVSNSYANLILPSASWSLRVTTTISQAAVVTALAADL